MEKDKAVDSQKISNLEMKLASLEDRRRIEVSTIEKEYERLKEVYKTQKSELSIELSRLRD